MTVEPDHRSQATTRGSIPADSFANRLMLARAHAGHISIREAADMCGLGRGAWTNWEKGARPVDIIEISQVVAEKLGVDRDWLLFGGNLGEAGPRMGRRIRIIADNGAKEHLPEVNRSADPGRVSAPYTRHTAGASSPMSPQRRDSTRPQSAVPATKRRPTTVRSPSRPMAA